MNSRCNLQTFRGFVFFFAMYFELSYVFTKKSVLVALKRDLERVTLIAVGEISCVYCRMAGPTHEVNYA